MTGQSTEQNKPSILVKFVHFLVRNRILVLLCFLAITAYLGYLAYHIKVFDDPNKWPPENNFNVQVNEFIQQKFGGANVVTIQVSVKEGDIFNKKTLEIVKTIGDEILKTRGVVPYYLVGLSALKVRYMKGSEDDLDNDVLMADVPEDKEGIERIKWGVYHNPTIYGSIVSLDAKSTIIIGDFRTGFGETSPLGLPQTNPVEIYKAIQNIVNSVRDEDHIINIAGSPIIIGWVNSDGLPYVLWAFIAFLVGIIVVLYMSLRRRRAVILSVTMGLLAIIWAFGLFVFFIGDTLKSASGFLAPFIVMATITCHSVQFFRRFLEEEYVGDIEPENAIKNNIVALSLPIVISVLTDCSAFVILSFIPFNNLSVLGSTTAFGFLGTIVVMYLFLIPLLSFFPGLPKKRQDLVKERVSFVDRLISTLVDSLIIPNKARWVIFGLVIVVFIFAVYRIVQLPMGQDNTYAIHNQLTRSWNDSEIYQMEMQMKEKFKGIYPLNILIEAKENEGLKDPEVLRKIDDFAAYLNTIPGVAGCFQLPNYIKLMNRFLHAENDDYLTIPDDRQTIGEYLFLYSLGEPGSFDAVVTPEYDMAVLTAYVSDTSLETVDRVFESAKQYATDQFNSDKVIAKIGGGSIGIAEAFNQSIRKWLVISTFLSALATLIIVLLILRTIVGGLVLLLPLLWGALIWLWLIHLLGIPIDSNAASSMAIAMGIAIDPQFYFLYRFREEYAKGNNFDHSLGLCFSKILKGVFFSQLALIVGLMILAPIPLYIGSVGFCMGLIILVCFVVTFLTSPIMWSALKPKFLTKGLD